MIGAFVQVGGRANAYVGYIICENGCWEWTGSRDGGGYGRYHHTGAHRWMYTQHRGAIRNGLVLDHLCRNPCCVNPAHLEPVTMRENVLRGRSAGRRLPGNQFRYRATGYPSREAADKWADALKAAKSPTCRGIFVVDRDKE